MQRVTSVVISKACVGGVTTRRFIHDENTVTKDRPRTNSPPKVSVSPSQLLAPPNQAASRHVKQGDIADIWFSIEFRICLTLGRSALRCFWVVGCCLRSSKWYTTTDEFWDVTLNYFIQLTCCGISVSVLLCVPIMSDRRCVSINASAPIRI